MKWNSGNSRTPQPTEAWQKFKEYEVQMIERNINYDIVEVDFPKIHCYRNLGNIHLPVTVEPPVYAADENAVAKVDGVDGITDFDVEIALFLVNEVKRPGEKIKVKFKLSKNVQAIMRDAGVL